MIRVLHLGKYYPPAPGGMERVVQLLCEGERAHVDSRVLAANTGRRTVREVWRGVPVTRVASLAAIGSVGVCPTFPIEHARAPRDVTVLHEPNPLALVSDFVARQRGPLVVWFHSEVLRPRWKYRLIYRPFLRRVLRRAARIVVSSPNLAEHAEELRDFRDKCVVIPFGLDLAPLAQTDAVAARARAIREARGAGRRGLLFVGRLVPYKGVDVLLRALPRVDADATIVGDGPLRGELERLAAREGVADRVRFTGPATDEDVVAEMHACDVFVLPSVTRAEAFGMVQIEAMACGRPVVSTNLPSGVPWVNRDGETGLVVPPGDPDALAAALSRLLADDAWRARLGRQAHERVLREFTAEHMAARTAALYREVAGAVAGAAKALRPAASR